MISEKFNKPAINLTIIVSVINEIIKRRVNKFRFKFRELMFTIMLCI